MANKKLTSSNILSLYSKTFTQKKILLEAEGQTFEVLIDTKFQPTKLQEMIMELAEKQQEIRKINDILNISYFASFLVIKYFTNIQISKTDSLEKQIRVFKALVDLEILEPLLEHFDSKELEKVNKYIVKAATNIKNLENNPDEMKDLEEMIQELASLQNPEVFLDEQEEVE